jgi:pentachlorophenol monooxygenase/3-(3-hydroxy-phenyl)propionate hydroxylase
MRFLVPQDDAEQAARTVDSGRLAEPYWYVDSPLTTTAPHRPFQGRPPKGQPCVPAPGVIVPDVRIAAPDSDAPVRLRDLARDGFTLLLAVGDRSGDRFDGRFGDAWAESLSAAAASGRTPLTVLRLSDTALPTQPGEAWLIRPDGHIAAILPDADAAALTAAIGRALAEPGTSGPPGAVRT